MDCTTPGQQKKRDKGIGRVHSRLLTLFLVTSGILLLITGLAKIFAALGHVAVLAKLDPVFGVRFNHLLLSVGFVELAVGSLCLTQVNQRLSLGLLTALSINFLGYRIGLWVSHWPGYCPCLGTLTQALHVSQRAAGHVTAAILTYLLAGSIYFWLRQRTCASAGDEHASAVIS